MTRPHTLLHCTNAKLRAARAEAWEGKGPGSIRVLLNNLRWERRLLRFLELPGVGRLVGDRGCGGNPDGQAGRVDCMGSGGEGCPVRHHVPFSFFFPRCYSFAFRFSYQEGPIPRTLRTAHAGVGGFFIVAVMIVFPF